MAWHNEKIAFQSVLDQWKKCGVLRILVPQLPDEYVLAFLQ